MSDGVVQKTGGVVLHGVVPLSCLICAYITYPQAAKQAAKICLCWLKMRFVIHPVTITPGYTKDELINILLKLFKRASAMKISDPEL